MRKIKIFCLVIAAVVSIAVLPLSSLAAITVDTNLDDTLATLDGDGQCSLREAIQNANTDTSDYADCSAGSGADTVSFSGVSSLTLKDDISVISDVLIQGTVTISGGNATRIFTVSGSGGYLRLVDVTLEDGKDASGGAILQDAFAVLDCKGSTFRNNTAENNGGAIYSSGTLDIDGCSFEDNSAGTDGGALYKSGNTPLTVIGSSFSGNSAGTDPAGQTDGGAGGALFFNTFVADITGSGFSNNKAASGESVNSGGGAIHNDGVMNITACVFSGNEVNGDEWHGGAVFNGSTGNLSINYSHFGDTPLPLPPPFDTLTDPNSAKGSAALGGAVYTRGPALVIGTSFLGNLSGGDGGAFAGASNSDDVTVVNSTFSSNSAAGYGGAIYHLRTDALLSLINVTITGNAAAEGGGLFNNGDGDNAGVSNDEVILLNSIIADNTAGAGSNCGGATTSSEGLNNVVFPDTEGCPNASAVTDDPVLGSPELTFSIPNIVTYAVPVGAGSSALGAGDQSVCSAFPVLNLDQRAFPRPQGDSECDAGAYEQSFPSNPSPTPTPTSTSTFTPSPTPTDAGGGDPTHTPTPTATPTPTLTEEPSPTPTPSPTATETATPTPTSTDTPTPTRTYTPTWTVEATATPTPTGTSTPSSTPSATAVPVKSSTPTVTPSPTTSSTVTAYSTQTPAPTPDPGVGTDPTVTPCPPGSTACVQCSPVSLGGLVEEIQARARDFRNLNAFYILKLSGRDAGRLRKRNSEIYKGIVSLVSELPQSVLECSATPLCREIETNRALVRNYARHVSGLSRLNQDIRKPVAAYTGGGGTCRGSAEGCRARVRKARNLLKWIDRKSTFLRNELLDLRKRIPTSETRCDV